MLGLAYAETISINLEAGSFKSSQDADGLHRFSMDGYEIRGGPGNPKLPSKVFNILIPPDIIWDSLELVMVESQSEILPETYKVMPGTPDAAYIDGKTIYD